MAGVRAVVCCLLAATFLAACSAEPEPQNESTQRTATPASPIQRCMNLSGALEAPEEGLWGYTVRETDLDKLAAAGFDAVRLPVKWSAYAAAEAPYTIEPALLKRVDEIIDYALERGLKVVLDVHHYDELNEAPDAHTPRLTAIWTQLATHYADYPDGLIFELINEPHSKLSLARVDALNLRLLEQVRETNPDRWVVLGTGQWGTLDGLLGSHPPIDARTVLSVHYYSPFKFTHQGAFFVDPPIPTGTKWGSDADRAAVTAELTSAANFAAAKGAPILLGEFGVYEGVPLEGRATWTAHTRGVAEDLGMGWCHWGYATTFKAYDPDTETWLAPIRKALIQK